MRKLTKTAARKMNAARLTHGAGTGRPRKPAPCPKCSTPCPSISHARLHCST